MQDFLTRTVIQNEYKIDLLQSQQILYWTFQWQISPQQLDQAIKACGSNNVREVKEYLRNKGFAL